MKRKLNDDIYVDHLEFEPESQQNKRFKNNDHVVENSSMLFELGLRHEKQKDYENMIKYYLMAIEKGNSDAMNNLGIYYEEQKDYENMMKYYLMAI